MTKHYCVTVHMIGSIEHVENNIDMIISSIDHMGLDECHIHVCDCSEVEENDA